MSPEKEWPSALYLSVSQSGPAVKIAFDTGPGGELCSTWENRGLFHQRDDGFASLGPCGLPCGGLFRSEEPSLTPHWHQDARKWQERRIIPVYSRLGWVRGLLRERLQEQSGTEDGRVSEGTPAPPTISRALFRAQYTIGER